MYSVSSLVMFICLRVSDLKVYPFKARLLLCIPTCLTFKNSTFCLRSKLTCFVRISERTAIISLYSINPLTPNDDYSGRTAPLTSKRCILYIYSTNIGTEYFKHDIYCPFFPLQNAVCFINLTYLVPVLFTFYIQVC